MAKESTKVNQLSQEFDYEQRVRELEKQGCTRSDAQSVVDAEMWCAKNKINPQNFH